jgi:multiple sugar transport system ATP-binding protein
MNFLTLKVTGSGSLKGDSFELRPLGAHEETLKKLANKDLYFGIRPEDLAYTEQPGDNTIPATITVVEPLGAEIHLWLSAGNQPIVARVEPHYTFKVGDTINFRVNMEKAQFFDRETELSLLV